MTTSEISVRDFARDDQVAKQILAHHAGMVAELDRLTSALRDATPEQRDEAHRRVAEWFRSVLVPHAEEEQATTYRAAATLAEGRLLIDAMVREHGLIKRLIQHFGDSEPSAAAAYARAVFEAFDSHQRKENEIILPLLIAAPSVSLADVVGEAHEHQTGGHAHEHAHH